jgi:threonine aldolase
MARRTKKKLEGDAQQSTHLANACMFTMIERARLHVNEHEEHLTQRLSNYLESLTNPLASSIIVIMQALATIGTFLLL